MKRTKSIVASIVLVAAIAAASVFGVRSRSRVRREAAALAAAGATTSDVVRARDEARASLDRGPMPIDAAMHALAERGRLGLGPDLAPTQTYDPSALGGWVFRSKDVPEWMLAPPAPSASAP